ncbi:MAG: sulfur transferase domain-containing protein [Halieaceae bacterium]
MLRLIMVNLLALLLATPTLAEQQQPANEGPGEKIINYHRLGPTLATSGELAPGAAAELKALGFVTVVDLRAVDEGTAEEAAELAAVGIKYVNLPLGKDWPTPELINQASMLLDDAQQQPLLLHCVSGNRAAVVWAAYRKMEGVPYEQILQEARTIGLKPEREPQLRDQFGHPDELAE